MKIQRLHIGDFGILRNQTLEDLHPGIVVIGGLNRAGKSTLMQVLRYLAYGFPQSKELPPATSKYMAEADIRLDSGDVYNISLTGHAQPVLKRVSGTGEEVISAEELYGIDAFTYRQLFTITLDELNNDYGLSGDEKRKLQSILLGAGLKDLLLIPQLRDEFYKEGDKIGGKRGKPNVKQFKGYYQSIEDGINIKRKALLQVEEYHQKQQELEDKKKLSQEISKELEKLEDEIVQLDIVKNNYKAYKHIQKLQAWLHDNKDKHWEELPSEYDVKRLESLGEEYVQLKKNFKQKEIELGISPQIRELLLDKEDEMASLVAGISGINERIRQYTKQSQEYHKKQQQLITKIKEINAAWDENNIEHIAEIRTDNISHGRIQDLLEEHKDLTAEYKNHKADLIKLQEDYRTLQNRNEDIRDEKAWQEVKKYFYSSLAFILLGLVLTFINPLSGILIGLGGIAGTAVYYIMSFLNSREARALVQAHKEQIEEIKSQIQAKEGIIEELESQLNNIKLELDEYKIGLGLSKDTPSRSLPGHLLGIRDIQERITELDGIAAQISHDRNYIEERYDKYLSFISLFSQESDQAENKESYTIAERWDRLVAKLNDWYNCLEEVKEIYVLQQKIKSVEQEIVHIMEKYGFVAQSLAFGDKDYEDLENRIALFLEKSHNAIKYNETQASLEEIRQSVLSSMSTDGIRRAFAYSLSPAELQEDELLQLFMESCNQYASQEEAAEIYNLKLQERNEKIQLLNELKESQQKLESELERLATTENLLKAQRQIDKARSELRVLAGNYALNMTAAFLLDEIEKKLLQGMQDSIMDSAGNIFNQMTKGDYSGILPSMSSSEWEFQAILSKNAQAQTIDMLSRGTREQLYLAVRLSRIMDIKPCLPVIIDDSFANFDSIHLCQSIEILSQLAKSHQIFILTCHGELVDEIAKSQCEAQYWKIERGRLELSACEKLSSYLRVS